MIYRSHETEKTDWTELFNACRTAVRAPSGIRLAEYLLPSLVAFLVCFGNGRDRKLFLEEVEAALRNEKESHQMPPADLRKAISTLFLTLETLNVWANWNTRPDKRTSRSETKSLAGEALERSKWLLLDPSKRIKDSISEIMFQSRARAAASVNLHACALRFFELAAREKNAKKTHDADFTIDPTVSQASGKIINMHDFKATLMALGDFETLSSLDETDLLGNSLNKCFDTIREKEGLQDWSGALRAYERAIQLYPNEDSLRSGSLRCLLELGHYESLLRQAKADNKSDSKPLEVEALCRLGRWESIDELVVTDSATKGIVEPLEMYQLSMGKLMSAFHKKDHKAANSSIRDARNAVMESLSSTARESYSRAYNDVVRLQIVREMEDVAEVLCSDDTGCFGKSVSSFSWDRRLELMSTAGSSEAIRGRIGLSRLLQDKELETRHLVRLGTIARKLHSPSIAASCLSHAESLVGSLPVEKGAEMKQHLRLEIAKLKHSTGESTAALRILGKEQLCRAVDKEGLPEDGNLISSVRCELKATRWVVEGGLKESDEIIPRFENIVDMAPKFSKGMSNIPLCADSNLTLLFRRCLGHFHFAKYIDSLLTARVSALQGKLTDTVAPNLSEDSGHKRALQHDSVCQNHLLRATKLYVSTLRLDTKLHKYVYEALPRLLSLWFEFTSIPSSPQISEKPKRSSFRLTQSSKEGTTDRRKIRLTRRSWLSLIFSFLQRRHSTRNNLNLTTTLFLLSSKSLHKHFTPHCRR